MVPRVDFDLVYKFWEGIPHYLLKTHPRNLDQFLHEKIDINFLDHNAVECGRICKGNV